MLELGRAEKCGRVDGGVRGAPGGRGERRRRLSNPVITRPENLVWKIGTLRFGLNPIDFPKPPPGNRKRVELRASRAERRDFLI